MRNLLDAPSQRMITILETLTIHGGWITLSELSSLVTASERTVATDVSNLQKKWGKSLNIEVSRKNGVLMHNRNFNCIGHVVTDLFNDSVALLWIKELLFHPNMAIEFYESKLFASRSTLLRLLSRINHSLSDKGIEILCDNNRYQLIGKDEQYLRDFSASFLLELYGLNLQKYDITIDLNVTREMIMSTISQNLEDIELSWIINDDVAITYLLMFYLISLVRENQGYTVASNYPVEKEIDMQKFIYIQEQFSNITIDNLRPIHQMVFNRYCGWDSETEKGLVTQETEAFFHRIFSIIPVSPNNNTKRLMRFMLESLYLTQRYRPTKTSALFDRVYYFALSLKRTNAFLYQVIEDNLKLFFQNVHLDINSNISNALFWLCLTCPELSQYSQPKKALLIADFGMPHAKFLAKVLSDFFSRSNTSSLQVDIAQPSQSLSVNDTRNYDIIITTKPDFKMQHEKVFMINDYPSDADLMQLYITISNLSL